MQARIEQWGDRLAVRIPDECASQAQLAPDTVVDISVEDDRLVIAPVKKSRRARLEELMAQVTPENLHPEISFSSVPSSAWD